MLGEKVWREQPADHDPLEIDAVYLGGRQRHHLAAPGPASQEIGVSAPQFARARSGQQKALPTVLDEPMHLVEQRRDLLHFVDDDDRVLPVGVALAEQRRTRGVLTVDVGLKQVNQGRVRQVFADPETLADATRAPEKGGPPLRESEVDGARAYSTREGSLS